MEEQNKTEDQEITIDMPRPDDEFADLEETLAKQISAELDGTEPDGNEGETEEAPVKKKNWFQKIPLWIRIPVLSLLGIVIALVLVINAMLDGIIVRFDDNRQEEQFEEDENNGLEELNPDDIVWEDTDELRKEDNVVNILLVGEEAIGSGGGRGRTDSIMIASANFNQKSLKLTSMMRDMYVQIPGYQDNKLNSAYASGGIPLLRETLEQTFDIELDGSILVNFDGFEQIIDSLGGVELTLTADEAHYLNTTNYVSNKAYRTLKTGTQILNGNQALGYMRIRYVRTADNVKDDFGRTSRQRTLLNAVFEKYKNSSLTDLIGMINDLLPYVQTDLTKTEIVSYATKIVTMGAGELETLRVPLDNMYDPIYVRKMAVLVPHLPENVSALHEFIYGPEEEETTDAMTDGVSEAGTTEAGGADGTQNDGTPTDGAAGGTPSGT